MSIKLKSSIALAAVAMATVAMSTPASAAPFCLSGFNGKLITSAVLKCGRAGIKNKATFDMLVTQAQNANCQPWKGPWVVQSQFLKHVGRGRVSYRCSVKGPRK